MSNEIIVETGTILESLNNKVDLDGGNYIGSGLETYINKNSKSGFNLFDTKIADHILEGEEALGWALQGTYVYKNAVAGERFGYPDFIAKCVDEKELATATEVTLGESTLTMYVNANGHQFYNIADKSIVDTFYNVFGIADFYGIDEENERIFLPRNKYFHQLTDDPSKVNEMMEGGIPNLEGWFDVNAEQYGGTDGALFGRKPSTQKTAPVHAGYTASTFVFDASSYNSTYGKSDTVQPPSSLKLLYYCVGNTQVTSAVTNVTEVTTSENDTIPLFTGMYFDFKPNNVSWLKAGEQQNSSGIYTSCYEGLVNAVNGTNPQNLKVINKSDMVSGVVYDEYWILDQDNLTFRTPLTISLKAYNSLASVAGNGKAIGVTDGTNERYLASYYSSSNQWSSQPAVGKTGGDIGATASEISYFPNDKKLIGLITDPTKSGIEAHLAENTTAQLYFKVANAVQNLELLEAGEVLEGLADKLDRGHKEEITTWGIPDYSSGVSITLPYTASINGFVYLQAGSSSNSSNASVRYTINGSDVAGVAWYYSGRGDKTWILPISKGDILEIKSKTAIDSEKYAFYPLKGVK